MLADRHRLLRVDQQLGTHRIELIHDRLVGVVRKARDARLHQEELQRLRTRSTTGEQKLEVELTNKSHAQRALQAIVQRRERLREETFGDAELASEWLQTSNLGLGNETPLSMLDTEIGCREVSRVLNAIAYGGAA